MVPSQQSFPCSCLTVVVVLLVGFRNTSAMPCVTTSSDAGPHLQCSHRRLTRFPGTVPKDVVWLDISSNFLTSLQFLQDPRFSTLQHLLVSRNSITCLSNDSFKAVSSLQTLDLSHNALETLPSDIFRGLTNLTTLVLSSTGMNLESDAMFKNMVHLVSLDLSGNSLTKIPVTALRPVTSLQHLDLSRNALTTVGNHSLSSLSSLRFLSLRSNQLTSLRSAAFSGLKKLVTLDLSLNLFEFDVGLPAEVFTPLVSLETLTIQSSRPRDFVDYPQGVFAHLHSLKTLSIDASGHSVFGTVFANLTSLQTLILPRESCKLKSLSNSTLSAFRRSALQTLSLTGCDLFRVELCAFCNLPHLTSLSVQGTRYLKISSLLLALYGVQNQTLEEANFFSIRHFGPTVLDSSMTLYMNNVCIKRLSLRFCDLVAVSSNAFNYHGRLLKCLKHMDISKNLLPYGRKSVYLKLIMGLTSLETLDLSNQRGFAKRGDRHYHPLSEPSKPRRNVTYFINTAPSLRYLNASAGIRDLDQAPTWVEFTHGGNLSVVDVSYCGIRDCNFTITELTNIHTLDLSGNDCYVMGTQLFQHMPTLRRLMLADVYLQDQFLFTRGTAMLQPLGQLEELDLSSNDLSKLPADLLKYQPGLQRLGLANNKFETIPTDLSLPTALEDIDLSHNNIQALSDPDRHLLDSLAANHTVMLRLRGNPLSCACHALDMIRWLGLTTVRLDGHNSNDAFDDLYDDNGRDYPCVLEDGTVSSTWSVITHWDAHWRTCVGLSAVTASMVAQLVQLLALLLVYLIWNNWTYVNYIWRVLRYLRVPRRTDFDFDLFLMHASDDLRLADRIKRLMLGAVPHLRLGVAEDEIPAGTIENAYVGDYFERSWKILLLVTEDFMLDNLSGNTVLQAQASLSDTMPHRVLIVRLGDLRPANRHHPTHVSMRKLLHLLPESNVFHVPTEVTLQPQHPVWLSLAGAAVEDP